MGKKRNGAPSGAAGESPRPSIDEAAGAPPADATAQDTATAEETDGDPETDSVRARGRGGAFAVENDPDERDPDIEVRVLVHCEHGKPNDVVTLPAGVATFAEVAGHVDSDAAAVAYAKTLAG